MQYGIGAGAAVDLTRSVYWLGSGGFARMSAVSLGPTNNPVPDTLARVIPASISPTMLGLQRDAEVFVTNANSLRGLSASDIAERLTIPASPSGFKVYEFPSAGVSLSSPLQSPKPGFVGGGLTLGGAPEFAMPNGPIPSNATVRVQF
jgi:hypothetical protein